MSELRIYVGRIREFGRVDWLVYVGWVGMLLGLTFATGAFLLAGHVHAVAFPASAWMVPLGAAIFTIAVAIDTIGHRTVYKEVLKGGEQLVHHVTIVCGVASVVLLVLAYNLPGAWIPSMVFTVLSIIYSLIDEAFHWKRYVSANADRVEMWSHLGIFVGHCTMMLGWWVWWYQGYPGVAATLRALGIGS